MIQKPSGRNTLNSSSDKPTMRCFNCSGYGHFAKDCKEAKRMQGSCFKCGKLDHVYKNCPKKTVAGVDAADDQYKDVHFKSMVSVALDIRFPRIRFENIISLFDTGSQNSCIRRSLERNVNPCQIYKRKVIPRFRSLGAQDKQYTEDACRL
ncbi:uncharacterized protein LOC118745800 [Rhagoletis pomonella]|uniref:uncharacterized protein LOC118745800 n=1 Tax=Rhagoletis pomonella TaxID=28610 RepID=UPI00177CB8AD|nr:uncharacterized protein LOC118745800 [Rhagoletis pomonella]